MMIEYGRAVNVRSSASIAVMYRAVPRGQRMELALSFTLESKPLESTPRNQRDVPSAVVTLATSTATMGEEAKVAAMSSALPFGMPKVLAMSLPVPHGSTPKADDVPTTP